MREIAADAEDVSRFPYVPTVIFGHLRLLAGMVRANRPWRLAARLYGVLAAFFSTQFFPKGNDTAALLASLATIADEPVDVAHTWPFCMPMIR